MLNLKNYEVWFVTGSQHLYGEDTLKQVEENSLHIAQALNRNTTIPVKVVFKGVLTTSEVIQRLCLEANLAENCVGLVTWMHTFSPAKMWIAGLRSLQKPFVHLHTQFNQNIPWEEIDMDFMNLNQSAHGGREFGFLATRMNIDRKVIVGHWEEENVQKQLANWTRAAVGWHVWQHTKVARFGDNMRSVAVTEGDKVEAQLRLGYTVDGYGIGDLVEIIEQVSDEDVKSVVNEYDLNYLVADSLKAGGQNRQSLIEAARIEIGLKKFLTKGGYTAFTTTFEDLHGLAQLPGFAVQRLMAQGYGFGAEGDWKTAALVRTMKIMASGLSGGTSFMEDYTYHFEPGNSKVLGAHMLEVCESIAAAQPLLEIHPLSIGNKADPVRSVFSTKPGSAINVTLVDLGHRFRMIVNEVNVVSAVELPNLPVARALWTPLPDLSIAATAWILAGGAHHTSFSQALNSAHLEDFAEIAGIEYLLIDSETKIREFKQELRWNKAYYG